MTEADKANLFSKDAEQLEEGVMVYTCIHQGVPTTTCMHDLYMHVDCICVCSIYVCMCSVRAYYTQCVFAGDSSRVVLSSKRNVPGSDYINASFIDVRVCGTAGYNLNYLIAIL